MGASGTGEAKNEYGEPLEGLVMQAEAIRMVGISEAALKRLIAAGRVRTYGVARLVSVAEIEHALSEMNPQGTSPIA